MSQARCSHPPRHQHKGRCGFDLLEDVEFIAASDGVRPINLKARYPFSYRLQLAERLGTTVGALDAALYRAATRERLEDDR